MTNKLTRLGARNLTSAMDNVADTIQTHFALLGIDPKIAGDYALRTDLLSDVIERRASENFPKNADMDLSVIGETTTASSVPGYAGFTAQIRELEGLATQAAEISAQVEEAVGPLLREGSVLDAGQKKIHKAIVDGYKQHLGQIGDIIIERKTALVGARARLKVTQVRRTPNQVQGELLTAVTERYGAEVADFIATTQSALRDAEKNLRIAFKGFELEQRALTASGKTAGLADLLARFQETLSKTWQRIVQVVQNAVGLVSGAAKRVTTAHDDFMEAFSAAQSKAASDDEDAEDTDKEASQTDKVAGPFNLFA